MVDGTYRGGTHTLDIEPVITLRVTIEGGGGQDGDDSDRGEGAGGDGGVGGYVQGDFDVEADTTLTLEVSNGRSGYFDGGLGGDAQNTGEPGEADGGPGGDGAGATLVSGDVIGDIAIVDGGGGGGGSSNDWGDADGGGGGGGARGGLGGDGGGVGSEPGGDGGGSGDGGDGGDAGTAGGDGDPGTDGGQTLVAAGSNTTTTVGGGVAGSSSGTDGRVTVEVLDEAARPVPPINVTATALDGDSIDLAWDEDPNTDDFDEYRVYRSTSPGVSKTDTQVGTVPRGTQTFTDSGLLEGRTYYYAISTYIADAGAGSPYESDLSSEVNATTILPAPTGLSIANVDTDGGDLSWTLNSSDEAGVLVEYRLTGASSWTEAADLAAGTEAYTLTTLLNGRDYEARVAAYTQDVTEYDQ